MDLVSSRIASIEPVGEITRFPEKPWEMEWRIPDFVSLMEKEGVYFSPTFVLAETTWRMFIKVSNDNLYVGLISVLNASRIRLEVSTGFKTFNGKKHQERRAVFLEDRIYEMYICSDVLQKTELLERKLDFLPSNALTVLYTLKLQEATERTGSTKTSTWIKDLLGVNDILSHECMNTTIKCSKCSDVIVLKNFQEHECQTARAEGVPSTSASSSVIQENKLQHDLKELFLKKENCDIVLKVQGQEFAAHKTILQARSSVFASTFRYDMKEKATGVVDIEDCDPSSFSDFLCFLYCADMNIISQENVFSLFAAADKYDVPDLRAQCMKLMKDNLSVDTFCDAITLALRHSEPELTKSATDFFLKNAPKIIMTVKWQVFLDENPTQSNELLIKLLVNKHNTNS